MQSYIAKYQSPIGQMTLISDGNTLTALMFDDEKGFFHSLPTEYQELTPPDMLPAFSDTIKWLNIYFRGENPPFTPKLAINSTTPFRRLVWDILLDIPFGSTRTYGGIAKQIAKIKGLSKMSSQAVGGAVGSNMLSIIIPCHRVIGANGKLTGYAGGLWRKKWLLERENALL